MEMILLDWTRLGKTYCLAGAVLDDLTLHVVRPLPVKHRGAPARTVGWSPYLLEGHSRWEIFELIQPEPADSAPPHLEDVWVRSLLPRRQTASAEQRRAILAATTAMTTLSLFGAPLETTRSAAFLHAGTGQRSLATIVVPSGQICFSGSWRQGALEPDLRVTLPLFELGDRTLPVKDHFLLLQSQQAGRELEAQVEQRQALIQAMGPNVAVRLGLSRAFQADDAAAPARCWLMADGFFSLAEPQY